MAQQGDRYAPAAGSVNYGLGAGARHFPGQLPLQFFNIQSVGIQPLQQICDQIYRHLQRQQSSLGPMALNDDSIYPSFNDPGLAVTGLIARQIEQLDCCVLNHMAKICSLLQPQPKPPLAPQAADMLLQSR